MQHLFISATGTNIGKTHTTLLLIEAFTKRNISVGVCKPIETGVINTPIDATLLLESCQKVNLAFHKYTPFDITAYTFPLPAAPFCADLDQTIKIETIIEKIDELSQECDLLLIEGAGGLMVPITKTYTMLDLIQTLNVYTLLVTPSRLGCINDTLLSIEALHSREIEFEWCVNLYEDKDSFAYVTKPYYDSCFNKWWSSEEGIDAFVERFLGTLAK